jgi:adenylate cyclase
MFYFIASFSTAMGILVVLTLNALTRLPFLEARLAGLLAAPGDPQGVPFLWMAAGLGLCCLLPSLGMHLLLRPIRRLRRALAQDAQAPADAWEAARRRAVSLPVLFAALAVAMWILAPAAFGLAVWQKGGADAQTFAFLFLRAVLIGLITATIGFFRLEGHARRRLIPRLFPEGGLASVPGALTLSIPRRLKVLYATTILVPMCFLAVTLVHLQQEVAAGVPGAQAYGREVLVFVLGLGAYTLFTAAFLHHMAGRSLVGPVREMLAAVEKVRGGDYQVRIPVVSSDEIGELGDAGNAMIRGLAEGQQLRREFGKYVTPEIRDEILSGRIPLQGERREATVMFVDLRGFTPFVESHPPEEVITSMREYFTAMHRVIRRHRGLVMQFVGDEIEAAFGVPVHFPDHARSAARAALGMRRALESLNQRRASRGLAPFAHGVGIHSGLVLAGNTGSEEQSAYALIGDTVNVASRLQELTKQLGRDVLVSRRTADALGDEFRLEPAGAHRVKGYSKPVEVLGLA